LKCMKTTSQDVQTKRKKRKKSAVGEKRKNLFMSHRKSDFPTWWEQNVSQEKIAHHRPEKRHSAKWEKKILVPGGAKPGKKFLFHKGGGKKKKLRLGKGTGLPQKRSVKKKGGRKKKKKDGVMQKGGFAGRAQKKIPIPPGGGGIKKNVETCGKKKTFLFSVKRTSPPFKGRVRLSFGRNSAKKACFREKKKRGGGDR